MVSKFGMADAKGASTLSEPRNVFGANIVDDQEGVDPTMAYIPYRTLVGSLMYLAVCTRPDLAMAMSTLSQYCQSPNMKH